MLWAILIALESAGLYLTTWKLSRQILMALESGGLTIWKLLSVYIYLDLEGGRKLNITLLLL